MLKKTSVAVEPGSDATRIICIKGSPGSVQVVNSFELNVDDDASPQRVGAEIKQRKIPAGGVVLGVGGQASTLRYNLVPPVPDWRLELIMKYELEEMVEKSGEPLSSDWWQLDIVDGESEDLVLLVGLGKDGIVQPIIDGLETSGAKVRHVIPHAVALFHAYRQLVAGTPRETVLLVDLGETESHLAIARDGRMLFARTVNYGGTQIEESIAGALSIDPAAAKKLRRQLTQGTLPAELAENVQPALRSSFGQFVSMLESSVTFCRAQTKVPDLDIDRVLVSGVSAKVPGLIEYLNDRVEWPVGLHIPEVSGEFASDPVNWVIPLGTAAAQLDGNASFLDLLPAPAKEKRQFRERTVFLYGSAIVLAIAIVVSFSGALVASSRAKQLKKKVAANSSSVAGWRAEMEEAENENRRTRSQLQRLSRSVVDANSSAQLLETVRSELPNEISIEESNFKREVEEGQVYTTLTVTGRSDDSENKGLLTIQNLQRALEARPEIKWVDAKSEDSPKAGFYEFVIELSSDERKPEKKADRRSSRGRGGR